MSKATVSVPTTVVRTIPMNVGIGVGTRLDSTPDIVIGYKAARNPILVAARKATNEARIAALSAELLADLRV